MISKMKPRPSDGGEAQRSPSSSTARRSSRATPASGESNIRRWIIENDWLDAIVALPDQLFYNTGISTYVWIVTNRKPASGAARCSSSTARRFFQKMKKSLGNKRNELSEEQIQEITRLYAEAGHDARSQFKSNGEEMERVCSKIFDNRDFGYLKLTIERPLRLNFQASPERIERLKDQRTLSC